MLLFSQKTKDSSYDIVKTKVYYCFEQTFSKLKEENFMSNYGYIRVSSRDQNEERQEIALKMGEL